MNAKNKLNAFLEEMINGDDLYIEKLRTEYRNFVSENYKDYYMTSMLEEITSNLAKPEWVTINNEEIIKAKPTEYSNVFYYNVEIKSYNIQIEDNLIEEHALNAA